MLFAVLYRKRKAESEEELAKFERDMMVNNTLLYQEYMKQKESEAANAGVQWITPDSVEEVKELMQVFSDIEKQLGETGDEDKKADEEFVKQVGLLDLFNGINIDDMEE